jgi:hypothetical protein
MKKFKFGCNQEHGPEVYNGFGLINKEKTLKMTGKCRVKTALGYYRVSYVNLINSELYIYNDENDLEHKKMFILTGTFVK